MSVTRTISDAASAMKSRSQVTVRASLHEVAPWVSDLGRYGQWMPLVHSATPDGPDVWQVELRAKVGVFARSKRLRMRRVVAESSRWVFERDENDGRRHSMWRLEAHLENSDSAAASTSASSCTVTMSLEYAGSLWTGGILDRVLAAQIEDGKKGLAALVEAH